MDNVDDIENNGPAAGWRFPPERRHILNDEDRRKHLPPEPILEIANIRPGDRVADVGAGTGYWTLPLSRLVGPDGIVYAIDVEPIMLDDLRSLVRQNGLGNVEVVQSDELAIPLPGGGMDVALAAYVLHEPADREAFVREIRRLMKPGGRVLLLDWQRKQSEEGPPVEHRVALAAATDLLEQAGFAVVPAAAPSDEIYVLLGTAE